MKHVLSYAMAGLLMVGLAMIASASDLAIYAGPSNPGWIAVDTAKANAEVVANAPEMQGLFGGIESFGDGDEVGYDSALGSWIKAHTGNNQQDVLYLACGTTPSALYAFPNKDPDGSNIELFIEDGNVLINVADWIGYMSYEGGVRSADNGPDGAANIFDISGLSFGNRGGPQQPTAEGEKYIPSLKEFQSARPWHLELFDGTDWEVTAFAKADDTTADPVVAVNSVYGGIIAAMWQKDAPTWAEQPDPRGIGVVEFISNWLTENGNVTPVEPQDKMSVTWGYLKQML